MFHRPSARAGKRRDGLPDRLDALPEPHGILTMGDLGAISAASAGRIASVLLTPAIVANLSASRFTSWLRMSSDMGRDPV
jgi:hypothetical protein